MELIEKTNLIIDQIKGKFFIPKFKLYDMLGDTILENLSLKDRIECLDKIISDSFKENDRYKNDILGTENELLKNEIKELDNLNFKTTQENSHLSDKVEELEKENLELKTENKERLKEIIELQNSRESDLYMEGMLSNALDKTTEDRNIYKETINIMCDKFGIEHREVFNIIDIIKEKDSKNERER